MNALAEKTIVSLTSVMHEVEAVRDAPLHYDI